MTDYQYMGCPVDQVDPSTGQCLVPLVAVQDPSLLPPLSIGDGITISMAVLAVWAVGFGIKCIRRTLSIN